MEGNGGKRKGEAQTAFNQHAVPNAISCLRTHATNTTHQMPSENLFSSPCNLVFILLSY